MWRAIVLALVAFALVQLGQLSGPTTVAAAGSYGQWWSWQYGHGWADFNEDCEVDVADATAIAFRWWSSCGNALYDQRYDIYPEHGPGGGDNCLINCHDVQYVFGRIGLTCLMYWDPDLSMGMYSYKSNTPTGAGTACYPTTTSNPPGSAYYVDPIGIVFTGNASAWRLRQELPAHGLPVVEDDPEQRFWEIGLCGFEDVDAGENAGGCCPVCIPWCPEPDAWERMHTRCEEADDEHTTLGVYSVCTPHADEDDEDCHLGGLWGGHYVEEVYSHPERIYPGFVGSGFDAGREWLRLQFGGATVEYWGNRTPIHQACGDDQDPASNGWVYKIPI